MIVVDILLWILMAVGVVVALVLLMPISFRAVGVASDDEGLDGHARLAWAFGFLTVRLDRNGLVVRLLGIAIARPRLGQSAEPEKKKKEPAEKPGGRGLFWAFARRRLLGAILGRYARALHLRGGVDGVVGLSRPDETAVLHQTLMVLETALPAGIVAVDLDWVEEVIDLRAELGGWVWPLQVVGITLWLYLDRKTWRALRAEG